MFEDLVRPYSITPGQTVVVQGKRACYKPAMRRGVVLQVLSRPGTGDKGVRIMLEDGTVGIVCAVAEDPTTVVHKT